MIENTKLVQRGIGVTWCIVGLALVLTGRLVGVLPVILGLIYIARTTEKGEVWVRENPKTARWLTTGLTLLSAVIVVIFVALDELRMSAQ
jgi:hypothetical protein